jgi:hypothetical protein
MRVLDTGFCWGANRFINWVQPDQGRLVVLAHGAVVAEVPGRPAHDGTVCPLDVGVVVAALWGAGVKVICIGCDPVQHVMVDNFRADVGTDA